MPINQPINHPLTEDHLAILNKGIALCDEGLCKCDAYGQCNIDVDRQRAIIQEQKRFLEGVKNRLFLNSEDT